MKRILLSLLTVATVGAIVVGASSSFFSDTESSPDNVFAASSLDLKIDFDGYYNKLADGSPNAGSWTERDLVAGSDKFFNFSDLKPGDFGEGTISLHVLGDDAWGRLTIENVLDLENSCTEPEIVDEPGCQSDSNGELRENLRYYVWLDQGQTAGFQGRHVGGGGDNGEGNNVWQSDPPYNEPIIIAEDTIDSDGEIHNLWQILANYRSSIEGVCSATPGDDQDGDGLTPSGSGSCQGLPTDGHFVESTTYFFGIYWTLPDDVGNEVQTDSLAATMKFEVEQKQNNVVPFATD